jgi:hypothetical protein
VNDTSYAFRPNFTCEIRDAVTDEPVTYEVQTEGGHYAPARLRGCPDDWAPEESESPDVLGVRYVTTDGRQVTRRVISPELRERILEAWRDAYPDYGDDPRDQDDPRDYPDEPYDPF